MLTQEEIDNWEPKPPQKPKPEKEKRPTPIKE